MRLIDADALDERKFIGVATWPATTEVTSWQRGWNDAIETIAEAQPTVDAVPVVRCKDCKFRKDGLPYNADGLFLAVTPPVCGLMTGFIKDDGWCFKGERKDDVEEPD